MNDDHLRIIHEVNRDVVINVRTPQGLSKEYNLIGIAEAGYKTDQLNSFVNAKTADKDLQFSHEKCKSMLVSKVKHKSYHKANLTVEAWELNHGEYGKLNEEFKGKLPIKEERALTYLGLMLSQKGSNIENIIHKQNRSIGTQKQIMKLIAPLGQYTFESAIIYIKALLRNSTLFAAEALYKVKESEYMALEMIEESVIKKVLKLRNPAPDT